MTEKLDTMTDNIGRMLQIREEQARKLNLMHSLLLRDKNANRPVTPPAKVEPISGFQLTLKQISSSGLSQYYENKTDPYTTDEFALPVKHTTAAQNLFSWPVRVLMPKDRPEDYTESYVMDLESKRGLLRLYGCGEGEDKNDGGAGAPSPANSSDSSRNEDEQSGASPRGGVWGTGQLPARSPGPDPTGRDRARDLKQERVKTLKKQIPRGYTKQIGSSRVSGSAARSFRVEGEVNGHKVDALPDSGAEKCYVKGDLARSLGLTPEADSACEILLPSKEKIHSPGSVDVEWKFSGESKVYSLKCFVLPICQHALILGAKVLRQSKTLTDFRNRIKTCIRPLTRRFGLHLLDSERERVWGFLDGCQTSALADFGSDVMAISASYAQKLGLRVNKQFRNRIEVEFADGSSTITAGMVFGVDWMFGDAGAVFKCDFHVLNNLPADVILSNEFLWEQDAFRTYDQYFYNLELSGSPELSLITHIGYFSDKLQSLYEVFRNNGMGFLSL
jgi:hypothetical protein